MGGGGKNASWAAAASARGWSCCGGGAWGAGGPGPKASLRWFGAESRADKNLGRVNEKGSFGVMREGRGRGRNGLWEKSGCHLGSGSAAGPAQPASCHWQEDEVSFIAVEMNETFGAEASCYSCVEPRFQWPYML